VIRSNAIQNTGENWDADGLIAAHYEPPNQGEH
jgi:hypothetical protein